MRNIGKLGADVDLESGRINTVFEKKPGEIGFRRLTRHPGAGNELKGFVISEWKLITDVTRSAARVLPSLRVLGWDIAVTPDGPVILEANQEWDAFALAPVSIPISNAEWQRVIVRH